MRIEAGAWFQLGGIQFPWFGAWRIWQCGCIFHGMRTPTILLNHGTLVGGCSGGVCDMMRWEAVTNLRGRERSWRSLTCIAALHGILKYHDLRLTLHSLWTAVLDSPKQLLLNTFPLSELRWPSGKYDLSISFRPEVNPVYQPAYLESNTRSMYQRYPTTVHMTKSTMNTTTLLSATKVMDNLV